jgi:hypothetical protein
VGQPWGKLLPHLGEQLKQQRLMLHHRLCACHLPQQQHLKQLGHWQRQQHPHQIWKHVQPMMWLLQLGLKVKRKHLLPQMLQAARPTASTWADTTAVPDAHMPYLKSQPVEVEQGFCELWNRAAKHARHTFMDHRLLTDLSHL